MRGDSEGPPDVTPPEPRPVTLFMGELVQRRHPALVALVFAFAVFLAVVPFLFRYERSPYAEALTLYDRVCAAVAQDDLRALQGLASSRTLASGSLGVALAASRLTCLDRRLARATLERTDPGFGGRAFLLTLHPPDGTPPTRFRVLVEHDVLTWWPEPAP